TTGASETSRTFALAHTGALAGSAQAFDAYAAAAGIVRLVSIEDAIEAVEFLARCPLPRGHNIAAVTNSGALRNLIAEAADRCGATPAALSKTTCAAPRQALGPTDITHPVDTKPTIAPQKYIARADTLRNPPHADI